MDSTRIERHVKIRRIRVEEEQQHQNEGAQEMTTLTTSPPLASTTHDQQQLQQQQHYQQQQHQQQNQLGGKRKRAISTLTRKLTQTLSGHARFQPRFLTVDGCELIVYRMKEKNIKKPDFAINLEECTIDLEGKCVLLNNEEEAERIELLSENHEDAKSLYRDICTILRIHKDQRLREQCQTTLRRASGVPTGETERDRLNPLVSDWKRHSLAAPLQNPASLTSATSFGIGDRVAGMLVVRQGFLFLQGQRSTSPWRKRYFVLAKNGTVRYFRSMGGDLAGVFQLENCQVSGYEQTAVKRLCAFKISTPQRMYYLASETFEGRKRWMNSIVELGGTLLLHPNEGMIKSGWLQKRGPTRKKRLFRDRFFILYTSGEIRYFDKQNGGRQKGAFSIGMAFVQLAPRNDRIFFIITKSRTFVLRAADKQEAFDWMKTLRDQGCMVRSAMDTRVPNFHHLARWKEQQLTDESEQMEESHIQDDDDDDDRKNNDDNDGDCLRKSIKNEEIAADGKQECDQDEELRGEKDHAQKRELTEEEKQVQSITARLEQIGQKNLHSLREEKKLEEKLSLLRQQREQREKEESLLSLRLHVVQEKIAEQQKILEQEKERERQAQRENEKEAALEESNEHNAAEKEEDKIEDNALEMERIRQSRHVHFRSHESFIPVREIIFEDDDLETESSYDNYSSEWNSEEDDGDESEEDSDEYESDSDDDMIYTPSTQIVQESIEQQPLSNNVTGGISWPTTQYARPIVLDCGTGVIKAGYGGEEAPSVILDNIIGRPRHEHALYHIDHYKSSSCYIGSRLQQMRGALSLSYPIHRGQVRDWTDLEALWSHIFENEMRLEDVSEHPLMLAEDVLGAKATREQLSVMAFETFGVPAICIQSQPTLAMCAAGLTMGVVIDIGEGTSTIAPCYEGMPMIHASKRLPLAGCDITENLQKLLRTTAEGGGTYQRLASADTQIVRHMKEQLAFVGSYPHSSKETSTTSYELPDGQTLHMGRELSECTELLFDPSRIGLDFDGIDEQCVQAISHCEDDLVPMLEQNILLVGGGGRIRGLHARLAAELSRKNANTHVHRVTQSEYAGWVGGSLLSCMDSFSSVAMSREMYDEYGAHVVHRHVM